MELDEALTVFSALEREHVAYVLIGSMAMAVHGVVRATRDMDVFVEPSAPNVERLRRALHAVHADPTIDEITAEDLSGGYPAVALRCGWPRQRWLYRMKRDTVRPQDSVDAAQLRSRFDLKEE